MNRGGHTKLINTTTAYEHAPSRGRSFLLLGAIAAAGVGLAWAFTRTHHEQNYRPRVTTRRNREGGYRDTAAPRGEVDRGYNVERRRTDVTSDDERLRTASGAVPPEHHSRRSVERRDRIGWLLRCRSHCRGDWGCR
jgi:hypothetical protein